MSTLINVKIQLPWEPRDRAHTHESWIFPLSVGMSMWLFAFRFSPHCEGWEVKGGMSGDDEEEYVNS